MTAVSVKLPLDGLVAMVSPADAQRTKSTVAPALVSSKKWCR